jgi:hypothetical protein
MPFVFSFLDTWPSIIAEVKEKLTTAINVTNPALFYHDFSFLSSLIYVCQRFRNEALNCFKEWPKFLVFGVGRFGFKLSSRIGEGVGRSGGPKTCNRDSGILAG